MAPVNELDDSAFHTIATSLAYAKLYPLIQADFMGKEDCKLVHTIGNQIVNTTGGPTAQTGQVIHTLTQGGSDRLAKIQKAKYKAQVESGDLDFVIDKLE